MTDRHILIDASEGVCHDGAVFESRRDGAPWRVHMKSGNSGRSQGVHIVELDNGHMSIDVLPTRGMGIWRVRRGDKVLGWRSPVRGPVHPAFVPLFDPSGLGWLEGFDELLCRCGLESNGAPEFDASGNLLYPLHGRIANLPAHHVDLEVDERAGRISLRGTIDETRFHFQALRLTTTLTTAIGSNEFTWTDEVENIGGRDATMQMLYHFNIGQPLLQPGATITAPIASAAPWTQVAASEGIENWNIMPSPRPGSAEQGYLLDLLANQAGETRVLVSGLTDDEAISLRFNKRALPCFTVWRNTAAENDGYVLGIEPGTNYPNPRTFEKQHGRLVALKPGKKWHAQLTATWHGGFQSIADEEAAIRAIQGMRSSELIANPPTEWSANP
jgi:galactose mutarotase-like enzyme